jgi:hypothetical protein
MTMQATRKGRGGARKGAGRPRMAKDNGKTSNFSTRITEKTRQLLDAEASRHGESLAVVAEHLLQIGLEQRAHRRSRKEKSLRALFYLIGELAQIVVGRHANDPKYNWLINPFMFEAFSAAVTHLLASLRPPGKIVAPSRRQSPEKRGRDAATILLSYVELADLRAEMVADGIFGSLQEALDTDITSKKLGREMADALRANYIFPDAFRDLGLKSEKYTTSKKFGRDSATHYALADAFRDLGVKSRIHRHDEAFLRSLRRQIAQIGGAE